MLNSWVAEEGGSQHSETNVMHFLFNLSRIKGLYMFLVTCYSSSGDTTQTALGILRVCYVSWLYQDWSGHQLHSNPGAAN
jgi:hypothetical protein